MSTNHTTTLTLCCSLLAVSLASASGIPVQKLDLSTPPSGGRDAVRIREVLPREIKEVKVELVSIAGPAKHVEPADSEHEVVWLFLRGNGTLMARDKSYAIEGDTIARAPSGWRTEIAVPQGQALHALRIRRDLTAADKADLKNYAENNAAPYVKKFSDCQPYREAIKSPKTTSRTLLPENYVPRMAIGTVETTGPDVVGAHRHPMLEQLFLGLDKNDITVVADEANANLTEYAILHIPLGSNHGAKVADGKKLYYVWMDFFESKEGQEWLKTHKPIVDNKLP